MLRHPRSTVGTVSGNPNGMRHSGELGGLMGFRAGSAEDVYRYILRLDGSQNRLGDRFGLSIVLVNDRSEQCRQFIAEHFVDLCERTAHRIRFVFFGNQDPPDEGAMLGRREGGFGILNAFIARLAGGASRREFGELCRSVERDPGVARGTGRLDPQLLALLTGPQRDQRMSPLDATDLARWMRRAARHAETTEARVALRDLLETAERTFARFRNEEIGYLLGDVRDTLRARRESPWEAMIPDGFDPIRHPQDTVKRLGWEKDRLSVIPGVAEGRRFAQALGLGEHVPCVIVFTDIGAPAVHVLPIGGMPSDVVHGRLCRWIDAYYTDNRNHLRRMDEIEEQLARLVGESETSLRRLDAWYQEAERDYEMLRQTVELSRSLREDVPRTIEARGTVLNGLRLGELSLPNSTKSAFKSARSEWQRLGNQVPERQALLSIAAGIGDEPSLYDIRRALHRLSQLRNVGAIQKRMDQLSALGKDLAGSGSLVQPRSALAGWRRDFAAPRPSGKKLRKARAQCREMPPLNGQTWLAERDVIYRAFGDQPFAIEPTSAAKRVVSEYANHVGHDPDSPAWAENAKKLEPLVAQAFQELRQSAPRFVGEKWGELPTRQLLAEDEALPGLDDLEEEWQLLASKLGADAATFVRSVAEAARDPAPEFEIAWGSLHSGLEDARADLEARIRAFSNSALAAPQPIESALLGEMRSLVHSLGGIPNELRYDFASDPDVRLVALRSRLQEAAGLANTPRIDPAEVVGSLLQKGNAAGAKRDAWIESTRERGLSSTPAARLGDAILSTFSTERIERVLPPGLVGDLDGRTREALMGSAAHELLSSLDSVELARLLGVLDPKVQAPGERDLLISRVLASVGADARPDLFGQGGMEHSLDSLLARLAALTPQQVMFEGGRLRRRVEQYVKQFVAMFAPAWLEEDEIHRVAGATLGDLIGWTRRILTSGPRETGRAHGTHWRRVIDRVSSWRETSGEADRLHAALDTARDRCNVFAHHSRRDGRELAPAELARALREATEQVCAAVAIIGKSGLYPICLRFKGVEADSLYVLRFVFESDPSQPEPEVVTFSSLPMVDEGVLSMLYGSILLMIPFTNPARVDPLLVASGVWRQSVS